MDGALGWLGDFFRFLFSLLPHLIIVRATHAGICWRHGSKPVIWNPGLHVYWPLVSEYELYPTVEQSLDLPTQTLDTADGETIAVSGVVVYEISQIDRILGRVYDPEKTVSDACRLVVKRMVTRATREELQQGYEEFDRNLTEQIQQRVARYGVKVLEAAMSDFSPTYVLKLWGDEKATDLLPS